MVLVNIMDTGDRVVLDIYNAMLDQDIGTDTVTKDPHSNIELEIYTVMRMVHPNFYSFWLYNYIFPFDNDRSVIRILGDNPH